MAKASIPLLTLVVWSAAAFLGLVALDATTLRWSAETALLALALAGAFLLLERYAVPFVWRGQRITTALTEAVVFVGLATRAGLVLVAAAALARLANAVTQRRPLRKTLFNVGQIALATAAAVDLHAAASRFGAPWFVAAALGTLLYSAIAEATLALVLSIVDRSPWRTTFRERFGQTLVYQVTIGACAGTILMALLLAQPVLLVAIAPVAWLAYRAVALQARAERENDLHHLLASKWQGLAGTTDDDAIARVVLEACRTTLPPAAKVRIEGSDGRSWEEEHGPAATHVAIQAPITMDGEASGRILVWRGVGRSPFSASDETILQALASHAATAFAGARACREVIQQRTILARQERLSILGTLTAGVAHEVNNPLTYLGGNIDLALLEISDARTGASEAAARHLDEATRMLETARRGSDRISHIVKSLRAVARERSGGEPSRVSLNDIVTETTTLLHAALPPGVTVEAQLDAQGAFVMGDSSELHQVVLNLVKNAVEATRENGGSVKVSVQRSHADALVQIEDDGPGVPPHVASKIFSPFFTTKAEGTGLGLSIAQGIVRDHGGELSFRNREPRGASFAMRLPLAAGA